MTPTLKTIFEAAELKKLTDSDIAAICGVHRVSVSRWRNGRSPSIADVEPLIKRLRLRLRLSRPEGKTR